MCMIGEADVHVHCVLRTSGYDEGRERRGSLAGARAVEHVDVRRAGAVDAEAAVRERLGDDRARRGPELVLLRVPAHHQPPPPTRIGRARTGWRTRPRARAAPACACAQPSRTARRRRGGARRAPTRSAGGARSAGPRRARASGARPRRGVRGASPPRRGAGPRTRGPVGVRWRRSRSARGSASATRWRTWTWW
jgi:hypothetical protein